MKNKYLVVTPILGLLSACSIVPEHVQPKLGAHSKSQNLSAPLPEIEVIGHSDGGNGSLGSGYGGGMPILNTGGGNSGGSGPVSGGGGSGGGTSDTTIGTTNNSAETVSADVGDTARFMRYGFDDGTSIIVKLEYTKSTHKVEKISSTTTGLIYGTVFKPYGNGIASYNSANNTYNFMIEFQFEGGTAQTGPIMAGPIYRLQGTYNVSADTYRMTMIKLN